MFNYITGFSVYTLAMIGIICIAFFVMKKFSLQTRKIKSKDNFLELENSLPIGQRKNINIIRAGNEKFLVATDAERTTFLTKLNDNTQQNVVQFQEYKQTHEEQNEDSRFFKNLVQKL